MTRTNGSFWMLFALFTIAAPGCDEKPTPSSTAPPEATSVAPTPLPPPPPADPLAGFVVDELGAYFRTERVDLNAKEADAKLKAAIAKLPVQNKTVALKVERNTKVQDIGTVVHAFGEAGAIGLELRTSARDGSLQTLAVVPESRLVKPVPDCAVIGLIKKDSTSAVWHKKGGTAAKLRRGLAGPDLSTTLEAIADQTRACASTIWFIAGEPDVQWGLVFDLGQRGLTANPPLRPTQIGLLREPPIAGRPVTLVTEQR
jgi:hypothetical protein